LGQSETDEYFDISDLSHSTHFGVVLHWIIYPAMNYGVIHIPPHSQCLVAGEGVIFDTQN